MFGGFGVMDEMNKSMQRNRELLDRAKESYNRRQGIYGIKDQELKFKEISPDELKLIQNFLEERARIRDRRIKIGLVSIPILVVICLSIAWLAGVFDSNHGDSFEGITSDGQQLIQEAATKLETGFHDHNYQVFRNMWYQKPSAHQATQHSMLHQFVIARSVYASLNEVDHFEWYSEAIIELQAVDSLVIARYRIEIYNGKAVLTDFTIGDWPKKNRYIN